MPERTVIGWREWVRMPDLGIPAVKAKVDTGARTSALHAFDITEFRRGRRTFVRFGVHPIQRESETTVVTEAELFERRKVKSSTGHVTLRPCIRTELELLGRRHVIELTLVARDEMGFRMLLGREALRGVFVVDAGRSFLGGRPKRKKKTKKKKRGPK